MSEWIHRIEHSSYDYTIYIPMHLGRGEGIAVTVHVKEADVVDGVIPRNTLLRGIDGALMSLRDHLRQLPEERV